MFLNQTEGNFVFHMAPDEGVATCRKEKQWFSGGLEDWDETHCLRAVSTGKWEKDKYSFPLTSRGIDFLLAIWAHV